MRGYAEGDPLIRVYDGEPKNFIPYREDLIVGLDFVFEQNQHGSPGCFPWYTDARSLSKGDVITLDDKAYAISDVGFYELIGFEVPA